jgi:CRISPR-associated protein Csb2
MATLVIEYLGTPCLAYSSNRTSPEWPPSPDRIYQALVATACELDMDVNPLFELEKVRPSIKYPESVLIDSAKVFVRSNQTIKQSPAGVNRPYVKVLEGERLYYRYPELSPDVTDWFGSVARNLTHIGRSQSQVIADVIDDTDAPQPEWEPHARGDLMLNTPYSGRLRDLDRAFSVGQRSQAAPMVSYRQIKNKYPSSYWHDLIVLKPDRKLHLVHTVQVTEAVRQAILSVCGDDAPNWIHGHAQDNHHIAITPLPNVGYR